MAAVLIVLKGQLFSAGYEGFKMPADFGFDILVTNQKEQSLNADSKNKKIRDIPPHYALQVKSRRVKSNQLLVNNNSGRPEIKTNFLFKEKEMNLILSEEKAYIVCVVFLEANDHELQGRIFHFWLHSSHLQFLREKNYIIKSEEDNQKYVLNSYIRLLPKLELEPLLNELVKNSHLTSQGKETLMKQIPSTLLRPWEAAEYITLTRPSKTQKWNDPVARKLPQSLTECSQLGVDIPLSNFD